MSVRDWVSKVSEENRSLGALLRGVLAIEVSDMLIFVWTSNWHRDEGSRREPEIRKYLEDYRSLPIRHYSLEDIAKANPMVGEAVALGGRIHKMEYN